MEWYIPRNTRLALLMAARLIGGNAWIAVQNDHPE
jgi:hypothetical protein